MTPQEMEALLDRLKPAPPPAALEERTRRAAADRPSTQGRRAFGIAAVAASLLACLGVTWLIVAPPAPTIPAGPQQADVEELVRALGNDDIAVRDGAGRKALERLRQDAAFVEAVKARLKQERDPEIRARLQGLITDAAEPPYRVRPVEKTVVPFTNTGILCHAAFSENGLRLAGIFFDGSMVLWSIPDAKELVRTNVRRQGQVVNCDPKRIAFSPDGSRILLTDSQQRIGIYDAETLRWKNTIDARKEGFSNEFPVACHPDGKRLAWAEGQTAVVVGTMDGAVLGRVDLTPLKSRRGSQVFASSLQFSADGKRLLAAGGHCVFLLDTETLKPVTAIEDVAKGVRNSCFAGREGFIVTTTHGGEVTVWDAATREAVASESTGSSPGGTYHPLFHAVGPWIFVNGGDLAHHVLAFRPQRRELLHLGILNDPGTKSFVSPDGRWVLRQGLQEWKQAKLFRMEPE
jgi:hypothetical protein